MPTSLPRSRETGDSRVSDVSITDLIKAYLLVHVQNSLWRYQTNIIKGARYCLTRF